MSEISEVDILKLNIFPVNKKYYNINDSNGSQLKIKLNCHVPFGVEKFNDKLILNLELLNTNENNNIISKINSIENLLTKKINNLGLSSCIKKSKLGHLLRTHYIKNTECFITKSNGEKIHIDESNLKLTDCDVELLLKGVWLNDNNYGLYFSILNIRVLKFTDS